MLEQRLRTVNGAAPRADSTILFSDFVENRWKPAMLCTYKPSTRGQYELALKNYLCPVFGGSKLREIDKAGIQAFFGKLLQRLSPDTVHGIHRVLQRILSSAIEWNYILSNPAKGIKLPPCRRREPPFIRREQFQALLRALPELVRTMVHMAMMTSMRIGEILAQRDAVDRLERYLFPNVPKIAQSLCNEEPADPGLTQ